MRENNKNHVMLLDPLQRNALNDFTIELVFMSRNETKVLIEIYLHILTKQLKQKERIKIG